MLMSCFTRRLLSNIPSIRETDQTGSVKYGLITNACGFHSLPHKAEADLYVEFQHHSLQSTDPNVQKNVAKGQKSHYYIHISQELFPPTVTFSEASRVLMWSRTRKAGQKGMKACLNVAHPFCFALCGRRKQQGEHNLTGSLQPEERRNNEQIAPIKVE